MQKSKYYVDVLQNTDCTLHIVGYFDSTRIYVSYNLKIKIFPVKKVKHSSYRPGQALKVQEG